MPRLVWAKFGVEFSVRSHPEALIAEENEIEIHRAQWLSKPDPGKAHGSMVLFLTKREDAERLLREVRVDIEGETAFAKPYTADTDRNVATGATYSNTGLRSAPSRCRCAADAQMKDIRRRKA